MRSAPFRFPVLICLQHFCAEDRAGFCSGPRFTSRAGFAAEGVAPCGPAVTASGKRGRGFVSCAERVVPGRGLAKIRYHVARRCGDCLCSGSAGEFGVRLGTCGNGSPATIVFGSNCFCDAHRRAVLAGSALWLGGDRLSAGVRRCPSRAPYNADHVDPQTLSDTKDIGSTPPLSTLGARTVQSLA